MYRNQDKPKRKRHDARAAVAAKKEITIPELQWGPVSVIKGEHCGRIGCYDDDDADGAIVYFGDFFLADGYWIIPHRFIRYATLDSMLKRREELQTQLTWANPDAVVAEDEKYDLLAELFYIESEISNRMFFARYGEPTESGRKLFISHSSRDKWFVGQVAGDLKMLGHNVWLDEHRIKVGQSIPKVIQRGIDEADFIIVFLSPNSVFSKWVLEPRSTPILRKITMKPFEIS